MMISLKLVDLDKIFDADRLSPSLNGWGTKLPLTFATYPTDYVPTNFNASHSNPIDHGGKSLVLTNEQATNLATVFAESQAVMKELAESNIDLRQSVKTLTDSINNMNSQETPAARKARIKKMNRYKIYITNFLRAKKSKLPEAL